VTGILIGPLAADRTTQPANLNEVTARAMNDLAEHTLHGLVVARRCVLAHPLIALSTAGFAASSLTVVAGARIQGSGAAIPLTRWLGLLRGPSPADGGLLGALMLAGILTLLVLWITALRVLHAPATTGRSVWVLAGIWSAPFALGPPLLSTDVYTYVARGLLARAGIDPYEHGATALGSARLVGAIDPSWRSTPSTSGPLAGLLQHVAVTVSGGNALGAVLVLRAVTVLSVIAIGMLAAELAGPRHAVSALAMTVLNPALLLLVVATAHLEGLLGALLLGTLVAAAKRRWLLAVLLACGAAGVQPVAIVALPAVVLAHGVAGRARFAWGILARDVVAAAAALAACTLAVRNGLGWADNLSTVSREHTPFAPAALVSDLIAPIVAPASYDDLALGGRAVALLAAASITLYLLVTSRPRPLDRTIGFSLLAIGLLGPVLYPWYLTWGLVCLAPTAARARRDWIVAISGAACVIAPIGFASGVAIDVTRVALVVIAGALASRLYLRHQADARFARVAGDKQTADD
jgi:hypothetical protein